jgi:Rieske Fe-S protein
MNPQIGSGGPPAPQDRQRYLEDSVSQPDQFPTADHGATHGSDRRTVIGMVGIVGLGVVGAATLAACGGGSRTANQSGSAASGAAGSAGSGNAVGGPTSPPQQTRGGAPRPPRGQGGGDPAQGGEFKAVSAICTHKGCTVAGVANGTITCPCHARTTRPRVRSPAARPPLRCRAGQSQSAAARSRSPDRRR